MKAISLILIGGLLLGACTSMRSLELPPGELRSGIRNGELVSPGDRISVVTTDGKSHTLQVVTITNQAIQGQSASIPINEIITLRTRQTNNAGKNTALAVGGSLAAIWIIGSLAAAAAIIEIIDEAGEDD